MRELAGTNNLQLLSPDELALVSGAWSERELGASMFGGAVAGGMAGSIAPGVGTFTGAVAGALTGGAGYTASELYKYYFK